MRELLVYKYLDFMTFVLTPRTYSTLFKLELEGTLHFVYGCALTRQFKDQIL